MERHTALAFLDLSGHATEHEIISAAEKKRSGLEERIARAPIMNLKVKYRNEITLVDEALKVLTEQAIAGSDWSDLPVGQKIEVDTQAFNSQPPEAMPGGRRPPERPSSLPSETAPKGRTPPNRPPIEPPPFDSTEVDSRNTGRRPPVRPGNTATNDDGLESSDNEPPPIREPKPPRPPLSPKVFWSILGGAASIILLMGWSIWQFWYLPAQTSARAQLGHQSLATTSGDLSSMPTEGELVHAKIRAICQMAIALGSTGHEAEGSGFLSEASTLIGELPEGPSKSESACRLVSAQAATGNASTALANLTTMQMEREKAERKGRPIGPNAPPPRVPVYEDVARRSIAIALARKGQPDQASRLIQSVSQNNEDLACEALNEIARAFMASGDQAQALQALQALETKAKLIGDPVRKAPMLGFVAERMYAMLGSTKAKQWVTDALNGINSNSSSSSAGYPDINARKAIAQAITLPIQLRVGGEQKDTYRKKVEDISSLAATMQAVSGAISGQPDYLNRATAYSHIAVAWYELAKRWFSGDAKDRAADAIKKALEAAEQVRPPAVTDSPESIIDKKEEALVPIIAALATMREFEQARNHFQNLSLAENQGPAAEMIAHQLGLAGQIEEGGSFIRSIVGGEPRLRAAIGLQYGLHNLPLEKWW
jgi:hypothetical protein